MPVWVQVGSILGGFQRLLHSPTYTNVLRTGMAIVIGIDVLGLGLPVRPQWAAVRLTDVHKRVAYWNGYCPWHR